LEYLDLYESAYQERRMIHENGNRSNNHTDFKKTTAGTNRPAAAVLRDDWLLPTYGSAVTTTTTVADDDDDTSCPLTILFLDPRLGDPGYGRGEAAWFALESAAHALPEACVLLLTSDCLLWKEEEEQQDHEDGQHTDYEQAIRARVRQNIYDKSFPLFRRMVERGRVRMKIADWYNYKLRSCSDFSNPSSALMNVHFWKDEFLEGIDSDLVLTLQDDAALCGSSTSSNLDDAASTGTITSKTLLESLVAAYGTYAYTGAPWPPVANPLLPFPAEGMCRGMAIRWRNWLLPQRQWERARERGDTSVPRPRVLLSADFPPVCTDDDGQGPVGNGGLSLRSRQWMIRAIETCPHAQYSGLDTRSDSHHHFPCRVLEDINEDFYFSTVLRGIGAPLPPAVEAATFAVESLWPKDALDLYGFTSSTTDTLSSRPLFSYDDQYFTVPYGIHKAFWYHPNDLLRSDALHSVCPFFKWVFDPSMSRWRNVEDTAPELDSWRGIGT